MKIMFSLHLGFIDGHQARVSAPGGLDHLLSEECVAKNAGRQAFALQARACLLPLGRFRANPLPSSSGEDGHQQAGFKIRVSLYCPEVFDHGQAWGQDRHSRFLEELVQSRR